MSGSERGGPKLLAGLCIIVLWSGVRIDAHPGLLIGDGVEHLQAVLSGFLHPDLTSDFIVRVLTLMVESLAIGALGVLVALLIGVPLALLSARVPGLEDLRTDSLTSLGRNVVFNEGSRKGAEMQRGFSLASSHPLRHPGCAWHTGVLALRLCASRSGAKAPHRFRRWLSDLSQSGLRTSARLVAAVLRAVPDIIWAFLFVRLLGLGPGPAVLAIGLSFAGIFAKLFAEQIEATTPGPVRALQQAGASRIGVLVGAVLPQVRDQWVGYALFRFECGVRSASILGIVGAGGIGAEIDLSIRYFQYNKLATTLLVVLVAVVAIERLAAWLRARPAGYSVGLLGLGSTLAILILDAPWGGLFGDGAASQLARFAGALVHPTVSWAFLLRVGSSLVDTLAIAAFGTVGGAVLAFGLAPLATHTLTSGTFLGHAPPSPPAVRFITSLVFSSARALFAVTRALPELVWALIFVLWVGPGPFAGALAIGAHTVGVLGRLFSEVYEAAEPDAARALEARGAPRLARWSHGLLPVSAARLASFALFRFEVNMRATAVVGFVGAGGIGDLLHTAISLFHFSDLSALLIALFVAVSVLDGVSLLIRRRLS